MANNKIKKSELKGLTEDEKFEIFIECFPMIAYNLDRTKTIEYFEKIKPGITIDEIEILIYYCRF
jgi:hypothetical protein